MYLREIVLLLIASSPARRGDATNNEIGLDLPLIYIYTRVLLYIYIWPSLLVKLGRMRAYFRLLLCSTSRTEEEAASSSEGQRSVGRMHAYFRMRSSRTEESFVLIGVFIYSKYKPNGRKIFSSSSSSVYILRVQVKV